MIAVISDSDSINHARKVTACLREHPPAGAAPRRPVQPARQPGRADLGRLKNYVASTAVSWPGRLRQIHFFFRARAPGEMLDIAAPWTSPWLPAGYEHNFWNAAQSAKSEERANRCYAASRWTMMPTDGATGVTSRSATELP